MLDGQTRHKTNKPLHVDVAAVNDAISQSGQAYSFCSHDSLNSEANAYDQLHAFFIRINFTKNNIS